MTAKSIGKYQKQSLRTIKAHGGSHEKACGGSSIKKHPIPKEPSLLQQSAEEWLHYALRATEIMHRQGTPIPVDIIHHLLQECLRKKNLSASCLFHSLLVSIGLDSVGFFGDHLIRLFALCGSLMKGHGVFCKNPYPTLHTWNAILTAHVQLESSEKAIELFHKMKGEGVEPDKFTFLAILKACCRLLASRQGRLLHAHIMVKSLETDNLIGSTLVDMYAKCGCMDDACRVFDSLVNRDVVTWNAVIGGYVQCGLHVRAFKLIEEMQQKGLILNEVTFCCLLKACGNVGVPKETKNLIHDQIIRQRLESVAVVGNGIVDMYAKCGDLAVAREVFETLKHRDVVSWNAMMAGYVQNENGWMALQLFSEMQQAGPKPDKVTFSSILQACGSIGALEHGKLIHCLIIESGIKANMVVEKMLVDMYAKCGSLSDGCKVFGDLQSGDVVLWNSIIAGYTQNGDSAAALVLFGRMQRRGIHPNDVTYTWVLKACNNEEDIREGKVLHDEIIRCGLESNACIGSSLIDMYVKCGSLDEGQEVFDRLPNQDRVLWNTIIAAYAQAQKAVLALQLFKKMQFKGIKPDSFTFSCIMKACSDIKDIESGMLIHDHIVRSEYERDIVVGNSLVDMYGKFGNKEESYSVFQRLATRDVVSWNAFITGCAQNENGLFVLEHFQRMQEESIKPDQITYACALKVCGNIGAIVQGRLVHDQVLRSGLESGVAIKSHLVDMYIQFGSLLEGSKTFGDMQTQSWAPWNAMIVGHALHGSGLSSFEWFVKMQMEGVQPEKGTYLAVLKACANLGARVQGRSVHDQMIRSGCEIDLIIGSTLVDMYSKCGSIAEASMLFDRLPTRDVVSWNVMIAGYTRHGDYSQAERCLEEMQRHGLKPDDRTYSSILAACSRSGKADEGHQYFLSMRESYGVTPDTRHFTCMVDLLSRAGRLDEAEVLLKSLPGLPDLPGWRALLSACRAHGDMDLGRQCYFQAILSNPENSSGYVLMSNIYADAYMLEDAHEIQGQRIASGAWKMPGKAWIEIKRSVHEFTVGEKSLPQSDNIFSKLKKLSRTMDAEGHVPQVGMVLGWVPDEDGNALHACLAP